MATSTFITIDTSNMKKLGAELRATKPKTYKQLQKALKGAAVMVAVEARLLIGFYSSRIPKTVTPFARGLTVGVRAGGASAPHAVPFEHDGVPGTFRHPVFGNRDVWVSQDAHPFLMPALVKEADNVERACAAAIDGVLLEAGFR